MEPDVIIVDTDVEELCSLCGHEIDTTDQDAIDSCCGDCYRKLEEEAA